MEKTEFKVTLELAIGEETLKHTKTHRPPTPEELEQVKERLVGELEYLIYEADWLINMLDDIQ